MVQARIFLASALAALAASACSIGLVPGAGGGLSPLSPPDGGTVSCDGADTAQVRLLWTAARNASDYAVTVRDSSGRVAASARSSQTEAQVTLACGDSYTWRVTATLRGGTTTTGPEWRFTVTGPGGGVQLLSPEDGQVVTCDTETTDVLFAWRPVDGASHLLRVWDGSGAMVASRETPSGNAQVTMTCRDGNYSWAVQARRRSGQTLDSPVRRFRIAAQREELRLISPPDGAAVSVRLAGCNGTNIVTFTWAPVRSADSYTLELFADSGALVRSVGTDQTTAQLAWNATSCGTYRWRVTAARTAPLGPVRSATWTFRTEP